VGHAAREFFPTRAPRSDWSLDDIPDLVSQVLYSRDGGSPHNQYADGDGTADPAASPNPLRHRRGGQSYWRLASSEENVSASQAAARGIRHGNTLFAMAHEIGHGLIIEMNMPVLGREEDAADSFAIVNALRMASVFTERVLIAATKGWVLAAKRDKKHGNALAFYDEHGLDLQRAYNVVCFMVGSDPEKVQGTRR
jgi:hypothetical protein